ncbi:MAG: hypothetical protein ORN98_08530 [Alphaproteobacteria bacterium]|nr:hypothetical protein [Alphaproteobacteria bacterium]
MGDVIYGKRPLPEGQKPQAFPPYAVSRPPQTFQKPVAANQHVVAKQNPPPQKNKA